MSCNEHNVTDCLICVAVPSKCRHNVTGYCSVCGPIIGEALAEKVEGCGCYICKPPSEVAAPRVDLAKALEAANRRASELTDELGAMRSDRDDAYRQLAQMKEAFERLSRRVAKAGIKLI